MLCTRFYSLDVCAKFLTRSYLARSGFGTNISWIKSRTPHFLWRKLYLLHTTREFYSIKLICRNLYALFSHVKKAYTANQNGVQLFHVWKYNQSTVEFTHSDQSGVSIKLASFFWRLARIFLARRDKWRKVSFGLLSLISLFRILLTTNKLKMPQAKQIFNILEGDERNWSHLACRVGWKYCQISHSSQQLNRTQTVSKQWTFM